MDEWDRLIALRERGLHSEGIGPEMEWKAVSGGLHQFRHTQFWHAVAALLESEPGDYDDLPDWMTETATDLLNNNN